MMGAGERRATSAPKRRCESREEQTGDARRTLDLQMTRCDAGRRRYAQDAEVLYAAADAALDDRGLARFRPRRMSRPRSPRDIRQSTLSGLAAPYVALTRSLDDRALPVVGSITRRTSTI